ncbi:1,4-dihydroxy-2-naphthoate octaprenyltransferase [Salinibius halmophilus]|uniref:1,4-dihydroxy-2-naphthoate octaprenyltransferase n=1 Tax=Salinibius halmophilus TaxID=1853216 RepID=UPI001314EE46|nr:1,4-dihydroxy-2-naphthoate octaprenyltransferase [Salinibius halmophilus]
MRLAAWILATRPKTLPLALAGPFAALAAVQYYGQINWLNASFIIATIVLLQIIANVANDLGDGLRGTDQDRLGPPRALASGLLTAKQLKHALIVLAVATVLTGLASLATSTQAYAWWLLLLGALSIWAALAYTLGKKPYGYKALGDLAVAFFYGPVAVVGTVFLQNSAINELVLAMLIAQAAWAAIVLHINNMRDAERDKLHGKLTLAVLMGSRGAKIWYLLLLTMAALASAWASYYFAATILPFAIVFTSIVIAERTLKSQGRALNGKLAQHALFAALISLIWLSVSIWRY